MKKFLIYSILCFSIVACNSEDSGQPTNDSTNKILNGVEDTHPGVGAWYIPYLESGSLTTKFWEHCSAVEVKNRCVLTAAHCLSGTDYTFSEFTYTTGGKTSAGSMVRPIRSTIPPFYFPFPYYSDYQKDLQLVWMADRNCDWSNHYDACRAAGGLATWNPQSWGPPPALNSIVSIWGFGAVGPGADVEDSIGVGRMGLTRIDYILNDPANTGGGYMRLKSASYATPESINGTCPGDSGGPAIYNGSVIGIASRGTCAGESTHTLLQNSNATWLTDKIANFCKPGMYLKVSIRAIDGLSWGYMTPGRIDNDVLYNGVKTIACFSPQVGTNSFLNQGPCTSHGIYDEDLDTCFEPNVCEFNDSPQQPFYQDTFKLYATAFAPYRFIRWEDGSDGNCPCVPEQTNNATCTVNVNNYRLNYSAANGADLERASCVAVIGR